MRACVACSSGALCCKVTHHAHIGPLLACLWRPRCLQNVPETTHFAPNVRYEIGAFGWYHIDHLPASYDESKQVRNESKACTRNSSSLLSSRPPHPYPAHADVCVGGLQAFVNAQGGRHRFFNVWPYVKPLRSWIRWGLALWLECRRCIRPRLHWHPSCPKDLRDNSNSASCPDVLAYAPSLAGNGGSEAIGKAASRQQLRHPPL
jgi:hypothetical protein